MVGSAPKDDTVQNRQGQGIMSPKVISGQYEGSILMSLVPDTYDEDQIC